MCGGKAPKAMLMAFAPVNFCETPQPLVKPWEPSVNRPLVFVTTILDSFRNASVSLFFVFIFIFVLFCGLSSGCRVPDWRCARIPTWAVSTILSPSSGAQKERARAKNCVAPPESCVLPAVESSEVCGCFFRLF